VVGDQNTFIGVLFTIDEGSSGPLSPKHGNRHGTVADPD